MILPDDNRNSQSTEPTASQTVGPFFSIGMCARAMKNLVPARVSHGVEVITIRGRVLDGDGQGVPDAILELWRADANGDFAARGGHSDGNGVPDGFARIPTNESGEFEFQTLKPGPIASGTGEIHAPHLVVLVFMRGLLRHLLTRIYFPQEAANETDPVLTAVPAQRRNTLVAARSGADQNELNWSVHLQGDEETAFFEA